VAWALATPALWALGLLVRLSPLPEIDTEHESTEVAEANADKTGILQFPHLVLGALGIFLHVGASVISVDTIIPYAQSMGLPLLEAKVFPSYVLTAMIVGYVTGILLIPRLVSQLAMLRFCTGFGVVLSVLIVTMKSPVPFRGHVTDISLWCVVLLGFANSLTWAGIWPLALDGLGRFTKVGASVMIMGLCGNAILPLGYGWLADHHGVREAYWIILPCYLYLTYYAAIGHKKRKW
jgi:fucose permease